jgi:tryptophanyl-tRNA synthetase
MIRDNRQALRIFSGIQPTGIKHFGNYSGGFRQYSATQDLGEAFFCIVDLHSITVGYDPDNLRSRCLDLAAMLFATGLDPKRSTVFIQSHVSAHPEAAWLLGAVTTVGELRRMTQYKDKSATQDSVTSGLFTYPVLMAADILLYQTNLVPIGDDQQQHLELTRNIAQRFNARFGVTFKLPEGSYPAAGARIMDLQQPTSKMSTTGGTMQGTILLVDPDDVIRHKVRTAVTDSGRDVRRAPDKLGISNLIEIMSVASGEPMEAIERRFSGRGYGPFKEAVAEALIALIDPIRRSYNQLRSDPTELHRQLALGAEKARSAAAPTLETIYERMGFVAP